MKDMNRIKKSNCNKEMQLSFEKLGEESEVSDNQQNLAKEASHLESANASFNGGVPDTLVRDFEEFIDYLNNHTIQLTSKMEHISRKFLSEINNRMSVRNEAATSHTEQIY